MKLISTLTIAALISAIYGAPRQEHARRETRRNVAGLPIDVCSTIPDATLPVLLEPVLQITECPAGQVCKSISGTLSTLLDGLPINVDDILRSLSSIGLPAGLGVSGKRYYVIPC